MWGRGEAACNRLTPTNPKPWTLNPKHGTVAGGLVESIPELRNRALVDPAAAGPPRKLLHVVEAWLRVEKDGRQALARVGCSAAAARDTTSVQPSRTPLMPNKHLAFFR